MSAEAGMSSTAQRARTKVKTMDAGRACLAIHAVMASKPRLTQAWLMHPVLLAVSFDAQHGRTAWSMMTASRRDTIKVRMAARFHDKFSIHR